MRLIRAVVTTHLFAATTCENLFPQPSTFQPKSTYFTALRTDDVGAGLDPVAFKTAAKSSYQTAKHPATL